MAANNAVDWQEGFLALGARGLCGFLFQIVIEPITNDDNLS